MANIVAVAVIPLFGASPTGSGAAVDDLRRDSARGLLSGLYLYTIEQGTCSWSS